MRITATARILAERIAGTSWILAIHGQRLAAVPVKSTKRSVTATMLSNAIIILIILNIGWIRLAKMQNYGKKPTLSMEWILKNKIMLCRIRYFQLANTRRQTRPAHFSGKNMFYNIIFEHIRQVCCYNYKLPIRSRDKCITKN